MKFGKEKEERKLEIEKEDPNPVQPEPSPRSPFGPETSTSARSSFSFAGQLHRRPTPASPVPLFPPARPVRPNTYSPGPTSCSPARRSTHARALSLTKRAQQSAVSPPLPLPSRARAPVPSPTSTRNRRAEPSISLPPRSLACPWTTPTPAGH